MQRDEVWRRQRAGKFTASKSAALMERTQKGLPTAKRKELIARMVAERIAGEEFEQIDSMVMRRGREMEDEALGAYSLRTGEMPIPVDFVEATDLPNTGCSPDGLIQDDGLVEIKCPFNACKHLEAYRSGSHVTEYWWQVQHQMMVTGRLWCDIVSYDPRFPEGLRLAIRRVTRDGDAIVQLRTEIRRTDEEINAIIKEIEDQKA